MARVARAIAPSPGSPAKVSRVVCSRRSGRAGLAVDDVDQRHDRVLRVVVPGRSVPPTRGVCRDSLGLPAKRTGPRRGAQAVPDLGETRIFGPEAVGDGEAVTFAGSHCRTSTARNPARTGSDCGQGSLFIDDNETRRAGPEPTAAMCS